MTSHIDSKNKWMVPLAEGQRPWIEQLNQRTGVSGAAIIRELIRREMNNPNSTLERDLKDVKLRLELERLNDQEAAIAAKKEELARRLRGEPTRPRNFQTQV